MPNLFNFFADRDRRRSALESQDLLGQPSGQQRDRVRLVAGGAPKNEPNPNIRDIPALMAEIKGYTRPRIAKTTPVNLKGTFDVTNDPNSPINDPKHPQAMMPPSPDLRGGAPFDVTIDPNSPINDPKHPQAMMPTANPNDPQAAVDPNNPFAQVGTSPTDVITDPDDSRLNAYRDPNRNPNDAPITNPDDPRLLSRANRGSDPTQPITDPNDPMFATDQRQRQILELEAARQELKQLRTTTAKNNDKGVLGLLGDMLRQFLISGGKKYEQTGNIWEAVGGGIGGAGYAAYDPAVDEKRKRQYDIFKKEQEVGELTAEDTRQRQIAAQKKSDEQRDRQLGILEQRNQDLQASREAALKQRRRKAFFDQKVFRHKEASAAQIAELKYLGYAPEDVGSWDKSNPIFREVAGVTFELDRVSKKWVPTGLEDLSKTLVDFEVKERNPKTGQWEVTGTYKVPQAKAAMFKHQQELFGMSAALSLEKQEDQQQFMSSEAVKRFRERALVWVADYEVRLKEAKTKAEQEKLKAEKKAKEDAIKASPVMTQEQIDKTLAEIFNK